MTENLYGVYGVSGFGREVAPLVREQLHRCGIPADRFVFIDDNASISSANGHAVMNYETFITIPAHERFAVLAIADGQVRERLAGKLRGDGVQPWSVSAGNSVVLDDVSL